MNTATVWDKAGKSQQFPYLRYEVTQHGELLLTPPGQVYGFAPGEWSKFSLEVKGVR